MASDARAAYQAAVPTRKGPRPDRAKRRLKAGEPAASAEPCKRTIALVINETELAREGRQAGFAIVNAWLNQRAIIQRGLRMTEAQATVYLVAGLGTVQKLIRQGTTPAHLQGDAPLPREVVGAISRRAIAAASGLPRETVRRIVEDLIAQGRLVREGRAGVATAPGTFRSDVHLVLPIVAEFTRCATTLLRLGVLEPVACGPTQADSDDHPNGGIPR